MVAIEVSDTGIGMAEETVRQAVHGLHPGRRRDHAQVRRLRPRPRHLAPARAHDGRRHHRHQRAGQGLDLPLHLPRAGSRRAAVAGAVAATRRRASRKRSLRGLRVLLTDDNAINRQVVKLFLAPQGCDIVEATNGKEALDLLAQHEFDIVLLDVHMPVMDGKEAIQRIRAEPRWANLPVIALTADAMSGDREKYLALGMTDYVSKPVDQRELIAKMHQVKGLEAQDARPASRTA